LAEVSADSAALGALGTNRPLRIAMVSYYLPGDSKSGVGYWADQLAEMLAQRGHEVTMFSACRPGRRVSYQAVQVKLSGPGRTFRFADQVRRLDLTAFDVLHAHGDDYWCWRRRVPAHVRTMHGSCFAEALRIHGAKERARMLALGCSELLATAVADRTVAISPGTRQWMPWVREVLPDGIDLSAFAPGDPSGKSTHPTILFVGTYRQRKRGQWLVELFERHIRPSMPEAELWMVCEDCPAAPGVVPLGRLSHEELVARYHRAWVFCLPSTYEGLGIPYIEAMGCGTPVVATENVGARYVLDGGRAGVLTTDAELAPALLALLRDSDAREQWRALGLERARTFDLAGVVDRYEEIYRSLLDRPGQRRSLRGHR